MVTRYMPFNNYNTRVYVWYLHHGFYMFHSKSDRIVGFIESVLISDVHP